MVPPPDRGNAELLRCEYKREIFDLNIHKGGHRFGFRSISAAAKMTQREKNGCFIYLKGKFTKKI